MPVFVGRPAERRALRPARRRWPCPTLTDLYLTPSHWSCGCDHSPGRAPAIPPSTSENAVPITRASTRIYAQVSEIKRFKKLMKDQFKRFIAPFPPQPLSPIFKFPVLSRSIDARPAAILRIKQTCVIALQNKISFFQACCL